MSGDFRTGLLVIGHGTRSAAGLAEFQETVAMVAQLLPHVAVQPCYIELASPTIDRGIEMLVARGVERIVALPLLLFAAGHAKDDIPAALATAAESYPAVEFVLAEHLGCHDRLLALSSRRFEEALHGQEEVAASDTLWLMVGRGARDAGALEEMEAFVRKRLRWTPVGQVRVAYLAMAEPHLGDVLPEVAELRFRRVVVQPHLLFHGDLLATVSAAVREVAARWPQQQWLLAPHLGAADLLAEAVVDRFFEADLSPLPH